MFDWAHDWTDEQISVLEERFRGTYSQAAKELRERADRLMAGYEKKLARLTKGGHEPTEDELRGLLGTSVGRVNELAGTLAETATKANEAAFNTINDALPGIYAENANWAAYQVDKGIGMNTGFELVDESTVRRLMLMEEDDQLIHEFIPYGPVHPDKELLQSLRVYPNKVKDVAWNRQKFTASITQSILQGESVPHMAERLERVLNMDKNMATRAARTAATSVENAGRVDSFKRAKRIGIDLEQEWMAAIDGRTRTSHRELDGQHVPVGEKFYAKSTGHEIEFPGDPKAHPSETYGCRCTLVAWTPEMAAEKVNRWSKLPEDTTYDEWKAGKQAKANDLSFVMSKPFDFDAYERGEHIQSKDDWSASLPKSMDAPYYDFRNDAHTTEAGAAMSHAAFFTGDDWENYSDSEMLEKAIAETSQHFAGPLFRGMSADKETLNSYVPGATLRPRGVQSWTSEHEVALEFAKVNYEPVMLVDRTPNECKAMSIRCLSGIYKENEVLASGSNCYEVVRSYERSFHVWNKYREEYVERKVTIVELIEQSN